MKTSKYTSSVLLLSALTLSAGSVLSVAQTSTPKNDTYGTAPAHDMLNRGDRKFLEKADKSGKEEIAVSQAALPKLQNPDLRMFAEMMVSDHSRAGQKLASLAAKKGVQLSMEPADVKKWAEKNSRETDKDYADKMVSDHKDAVDLFEDAADDAKDADVKAFAAETLPTLKSHLEQIKAIKSKL